MTLLDIVVVVIIGLSGLVAVLRGMLQESFSLLGWAVAGIAVFLGLPYVRPVARDIIPWEIVADVAAGAAIFFLVLIIMTVITANLVDRIKTSRFGTLDRSLGLLYGLARGYVLAALLYLLLFAVFSAKNLPDWMQQARTRPVLELGAKFIVGLAPDNFLPEDLNRIGRAPPDPKKG